MSIKTLGIVGSALLIFGGCPKRQTTPRIVYVPAPPVPAETSQQKGSQALIIEAPPPTQPAEQVPAQPKAPAVEESVSHHHPQRQPERPPAPDHPEQTEPVPVLEPSVTRAQTEQMRREVSGLQSQLQQQIAKLGRSGLSRTELQTLGSARAFLAQSIRALQQSDPQRALNLAHKARLLVEAIEGSQ